MVDFVFIKRGGEKKKYSNQHNSKKNHEYSQQPIACGVRLQWALHLSEEVKLNFPEPRSSNLAPSLAAT
jgi:hypothetical protein